MSDSSCACGGKRLCKRSYCVTSAPHCECGIPILALSNSQTAQTTKETNPKDAVGVRKVPFSTVPANVIAQLGLAMLEGARKYGRHNYRIVGVRASVYYDAFMRHVTAWWEGQDEDPDSGLPHLVKAMACLLVVLDAKDNDKLTDDRPPSLADDWQKSLNEKAAAVIDRYKDAKEPYTRA